MTFLSVVSFLLCSLICSVSGHSNGILPYCDMGTNPSYSLGAGSSTQIMFWAAKPTIDYRYTVRTADTKNNATDPKVYQPNSWTPIHLRNLDPDNRVLGMMMYAIKGTGSFPSDQTYQVGLWKVNNGDPYQAAASLNGRCLTHLGSDLKPLHTVVWLKVPANTGRITIKAMVKVGEQNSGWFYLTQPLVLDEGTEDPAPPSNIIQAELGVSCTSACKALAPYPYCSSTETLAINSASALKNAVVKPLCSDMMIQSCSLTAPRFEADDGGLCVIQSPNCTTPTSNPCNAAASQSYRVCVCSATPDSTVYTGSGGSGANGGQLGSSDGMNFDVNAYAPIIGAVLGAAALLAAVYLFRKYRLARQAEKDLELQENPATSSGASRHISTNSESYAPMVSTISQSSSGSYAASPKSSSRPQRSMAPPAGRI